MALDSSQYDPLVEEYETSLNLPSRRCTEANFFSNLGDVRGLQVLDLSTGTGRIARSMAKLGASKVVGVDINNGMLEKAKELIAADPAMPKGVIELELADVFAPLSLRSAEPGSFDVVAGVWSLNYAGDQAMVNNAFNNIAKYLKKGGRFISTIPSKAAHGTCYNWPGVNDQTEWYGVGRKIIAELEDGFRIRTSFMTDPPLEFENYDLDHGVFFKAAERAGLKDVRTDLKEKIAPPFKEGEDQSYWDRYLGHPIFDVITASK